jgi:hypothetical protein
MILMIWLATIRIIGPGSNLVPMIGRPKEKGNLG